MAVNEGQGAVKALHRPTTGDGSVGAVNETWGTKFNVNRGLAQGLQIPRTYVYPRYSTTGSLL